MKSLVEECLDDDPAVRPTIATVCERIQMNKDEYMKESPRDIITVLQEVKLLRTENMQQKIEIKQLKSDNERLSSKNEQLINQMVMRTNYKYYLMWY